MKKYIVLFYENGRILGVNPSGFHCEAENYDHAEEQCENANPDGDVVWIYDGEDLQDALDDYYKDDYYGD